LFCYKLDQLDMEKICSECNKRTSLLPGLEDVNVSSRPTGGGVGGSSRFFPHVHGGDGGGGSRSSSSAVPSSSSELSGKIRVHDPDRRIGVDIRLAPKARAALGGPAQDRMESTLEPSPSGVVGPPAAEARRCRASLSQFACSGIKYFHHNILGFWYQWHYFALFNSPLPRVTFDFFQSQCLKFFKPYYIMLGI